MPIQVHQCASEHADIRTNKLVGFHTHEFCSLSFTNRTIPDGTVKDSHPGTESSAAQASRKSLSSIVVVPDTLSDEQKFQYAIVSVASTAQSRRSSLSEMTETYDPHMKYTRDSSTVPDGTALPNLPLGTIEDSSHATQLSSSPPVSAMNRKMKRSRSEVGSKRIATSATTSSNNKVVKRKGRSKTIARGEKPPCRETSFDELSLTCPEPFRKTGEKRARSEDEEELLSNDELHTFEETDLEKEQYQPRPSLRRSKSTPTNTPRDGADLELPKARAVRKKSSKATDTLSHSALGDVELSTETPVQASIIRDDSAMAASLSTKDTTEARARQTGSSSSKSIGNSHITTEEPADVPLAENVPTVPAQAKKRGRKKTSEIVAVKSSGVSKTQSADFVPVTSKDNEAQRKVLQETDSNKQPLQETASTPPTKASATNVTGIPPPTQTPTKDSKKGPDQHSPLQSGKVPYRVGLSKKTRIAPLLKMIRK